MAVMSADELLGKMRGAGIDLAKGMPAMEARGHWQAAETLARGRKWAETLAIIIGILNMVFCVLVNFIPMSVWVFAMTPFITMIQFFIAWQMLAFYERGQKFLETMRAEFWASWANALEESLRQAKDKK